MTLSTIKTIRMTDPTDIPLITGIERTVEKEKMIFFSLDLKTWYMDTLSAIKQEELKNYWYFYFICKQNLAVFRYLVL